MTVTLGKRSVEKVGTSPELPERVGRHGVLIAYLSVLASLLTAVAGLLAVLFR
jgi:hypothetical protein